jgi:sulfatase modifying factor 1
MGGSLALRWRRWTFGACAAMPAALPAPASTAPASGGSNRGSPMPSNVLHATLDAGQDASEVDAPVPPWSALPAVAPGGARSCAVASPGTDNGCGRNGDQDCCETILVTPPAQGFVPFAIRGRYVAATDGGTDAASDAATWVSDPDGSIVGDRVQLSPYYLDKFEVTVGRVLAFLDANIGHRKDGPPPEGTGAHPKIERSGWRSEWNEYLSTEATALRSRLEQCYVEQPSRIYSTFYGPARNPAKPATCLTWYEAFVFCAWDGGRLPTELEWSYAAQGPEHRTYPFSAPAPGFDPFRGPGTGSANNPTFDGANYCPGAEGADGYGDVPRYIRPHGDCKATATGGARVVGFYPNALGPFGHADLAGNAFEFVLDWRVENVSVPPSDSALVDLPSSAPPDRRLRGGSWLSPALEMRNDQRWRASAREAHPVYGFRCARDAAQ